MSIMGFMGGLETAIRTTALATANSARSAQTIDGTGPYAVARLAQALRAERRRSADLEALCGDLYERLRAAETTIEAIRRHRR